MMNARAKTAYIWGPISTFTAPLAAWLMSKGWHVHIATKSALNLLSLSPLNITSAAKDNLEDVFGNHAKYKTFQDRVKFLENKEPYRDTKYDALIFCALPPNFDDTRAPRAPWAAAELASIAKNFKGVPVFIISSLWGAVQADGVVPEELEFERRKTTNHWEKICQRYEERLIAELNKVESSWYFVRLPLITGATANGYSPQFTGLAKLLSALDPKAAHQSTVDDNANVHQTIIGESVALAHEPDATLWFLPVDTAVYMFWRYLEDPMRPRIFNLVSTQSTLNREWLQYLGQALELKEILATKKDKFSLPVVLKKLLLDNVQVKTRNLFELTARYQVRHEKLDRDYFVKIIQEGRSKNWGYTLRKQIAVPTLSDELASYYFEEFIPSHLSNELLNRLTEEGISVGFRFTDKPTLGWIIKAHKKNNGKAGNGRISIERYASGDNKPTICFHLTSKTMAALVQNQLPLHQALLFKKIAVEGSLMDSLRVSKVFSIFLKEHPLILSN